MPQARIEVEGDDVRVDSRMLKDERAKEREKEGADGEKLG
jgi:hypothetical protein